MSLDQDARLAERARQALGHVIYRVYKDHGYDGEEHCALISGPKLDDPRGTFKAWERELDEAEREDPLAKAARVDVEAVWKIAQDRYQRRTGKSFFSVRSGEREREPEWAEFDAARTAAWSRFHAKWGRDLGEFAEKHKGYVVLKTEAVDID